MELPHWVREPYSFLRFMVPGAFLLALGTTFFPETLNAVFSDMFQLIRVQGAPVLILAMWALMMGTLQYLFLQVLRESVLRPRPVAQESLRRALARSGVPAERLTRAELEAVYGAAAERAADRPAVRAVRRTKNVVEMSYCASLSLTLAGAFILAGRGSGPLVVQAFNEAQGAAFIGAGFVFCVLLWWRERALSVREAAAFPVEDPEVLAEAVRAVQRLWGPPQPGAP